METVRCDTCHHDQTVINHMATRAIALPAPYHVVSCAQCGLQYMNPRMTAEEYRDFYAGQEYLEEFEYTDLLNRSRVREFNQTLDRIARMQPPPGRLLDIGTATGEFLVAARHRGWDVSGTEISDTSVAEAHRRHGLEVFHGTLEHYQAEPHSFDVIHLSHVLEHVPSPQQTLRSIRRFLKPTGLVVIEVPHEFDNWYVRLGRALHRFQPATKPSMHHVYFFTPKTLQAALQSAGLAGPITTYSLDIPAGNFPWPLRLAGTVVGRMIDRLGGGIYIRALARVPQGVSE